MSADTNTPESEEFRKLPEELKKYIYVDPYKPHTEPPDTSVWDIVKKFAAKDSYQPQPRALIFFIEMCKSDAQSYFGHMPTIRDLVEAADRQYIFDLSVEPYTLALFRNEYGYTCSA